MCDMCGVQVGMTVYPSVSSQRYLQTIEVGYCVLDFLQFGQIYLENGIVDRIVRVQ